MNRWVCLDDKQIGIIREALLQQKTDQAIRLERKFLKALGTIKVSSAKAKGRELQQWVCRQLSSVFGVPYNQQDDQCPIHAREMGQSGVDVILRGELRKKFPFAIECKNANELNLTSAIQQAMNNGKKEGLRWMLIFRTKALAEVVVMVSWETFLQIFERGRIVE